MEERRRWEELVEGKKDFSGRGEVGGARKCSEHESAAPQPQQDGDGAGGGGGGCGGRSYLFFSFPFTLTLFRQPKTNNSLSLRAECSGPSGSSFGAVCCQEVSSQWRRRRRPSSHLGGGGELCLTARWSEESTPTSVIEPRPFCPGLGAATG